jgi:branched-chain amino acid transport system permease protein
MLLHSVILSWISLTGGDQGLMGGIPKPPFLGIDLARPGPLAGFGMACLLLSTLALRQVVRSPFGAALRMLRDNPTAPPSSASRCTATGWRPSSSPAPSPASAAC